MTAPRSWRDPGLQAERTALSWRRTMLTGVVVGLICVRAWVLNPTAWLLVATIAIVVVVLLTVGGQTERFRRYRHNAADPRPLPPTLLAAICVMIVIACAACLIGFLTTMTT